MSDQPLDLLGTASADLRGTIERELAERPGRRDLADVIARARAIDPSAVPEGLHALDEDDHDYEEHEEERFDPMLALFTDALRDDVEHDVRERAMRPATPPKVEQPRSRGRWAVALVAVAAAIVGVVSLAQLREQPATLDADRGPGSLAAKSVEQVLQDEQWTRGVTPPAPRPQPEPKPVAEPVPEEPEAVAEEVAPTKPRPSLDQLEREAAEAWRAGQLGLAESKLRSIIARAGRGPKAELAYGDLFAITKQRGGSARQSGMWKQYLTRFPQGRFADDARAGLCMRASKDAAPECWSDYLTKHPKGTHAARARRELARDETP